MITIILKEDADGTVHCSATADMTKDHAAVVRAIGMLELAKMSMVAGRWGVIDEAAGKVAKLPEITKGYKRKKIPKATQ